MGPDEIESNLERVEGWSRDGQAKITRTFNFRDFKEALEFVDEVGKIAEGEGHHPDIHLSWGKVVIELCTHAIRGLSENDFILAAKIDEAFRPWSGKRA